MIIIIIFGKKVTSLKTKQKGGTKGETSFFSMMFHHISMFSSYCYYNLDFFI